jgi:plasmid maintenance system killer protein
MKLEIYNLPNFKFKRLDNNKLTYYSIRYNDDYGLLLEKTVNTILIFTR